MVEWWEKHKYVYIQSAEEAEVTLKDAAYQRTKLWLFMNYPQISEKYDLYSDIFNVNRTYASLYQWLSKYHSHLIPMIDLLEASQCE